LIRRLEVEKKGIKTTKYGLKTIFGGSSESVFGFSIRGWRLFWGKFL
jgi:hypothetical protein